LPPVALGLLPVIYQFHHLGINSKNLQTVLSIGKVPTRRHATRGHSRRPASRGISAPARHLPISPPGHNLSNPTNCAFYREGANSPTRYPWPLPASRRWIAACDLLAVV